jgi:Zn-dependent membrane protease YugP
VLELKVTISEKLMFFFDPLYFIILAPALALSLWATIKVKSTFHKYNRVPAATRVSGAEAARMLLSRASLDIPVEQHPGELSDHYDPRVRKLRLSPQVFQGRSLAAIGVAAHEVGHALQHARNYQPLLLRQTIAPVAGFGSNTSWILIFLGFIFGSMGLVKLGIVLFTLVVAFQLITLPVEFNASAQAKQMVLEHGLIAENERGGISKVLNAAAMTYVAAVITSLLTLLYYLLRSGLLGGGDD